MQEGVKPVMMFGSVEIKEFSLFENGRYVSYSYSISYDREGREISRTEPMAMGSLGWDDGKPFTEEDLGEIKYGQARRNKSYLRQDRGSLLGRISILIKKALEA